MERERKMDLDSATVTTKLWTDWTGFKTRFLANWEEIDSPGNAYSELLKLYKRLKVTKDKSRLPIMKYTGKFKELIKKAGINRATAIYQYSPGLTPKEYEKIAMQNPTDLEGWYEQAHQLANIDSCLGVQRHYGNQPQSEWDMDVDHLKIEINAMTKEERE